MSAYNGSPQVGGITNIPRRAYITTSAFNNDFYTYTVTMNPTTFVTSGTLAANVVGATASTCPANRILRENGKRLYPDANPGVSTLMVGVYDSISGLKGYIDPNAPLFAVYNTDKSYQTPNGVNPNGGATDQGPPIYTLGSVTAGTTITAAGNITATAGTVSGRSLVILNAQTITQSTTVAQTVDCSLGSYFNVVVSTNDNFTLNATNVTSGQMVVMVLNSTSAAVTPTITFGTNIRDNQTAGAQLITTGRAATITFIGSGTTLVELSRTAIIAAA